jgi:hypothetical protein
MKKYFLFFIAALYLFNSPFYAQGIRDISKAGPVTEQVELKNYDQIFYISQIKGSDNNGDGSISKPWATLYHALNKIENAAKENLVAILVSKGTYSGFTLQMKSHIDLFGGFDDNSWHRDIHMYPSIIDGEKMRRVIVAADHSRIDGFTIKNGLSRTHGGGILCDDTSPTISNCIITDNYVLEPENFNYNRIHQNGNHGGGIACLFNAVPVIRNNIFYRNATSIGNGGGIAFYGWLRNSEAPPTKIVNNRMEGGWQPSVVNNIFIHNTSGVNDWGKTRSSNGGAISCSSESRPVIENNLIICNQAKGRSDAGGIYTENFSYPLIKGNWIVGNISDDDGGGIYTNHTGHALITQNFIAGNWTIGNGAGGIRLSKESRATVSENIIVHNQTGGGIQSVDSYMELINNIIMHNKGNVSLRYSNVFSYFVPSIIENNVILENEKKITIELKEGEKINVVGNNTNEKIIGTKNYYKLVQLENNSILFEIEDFSFIEDQFQTIIQIKPAENTQSLIGRVINVGSFWSVIKKVEQNKLYVWGNLRLRESDKSGFILSDYKIKKNN